MPRKPHTMAVREAIAAKLGIKTSRIYARAAGLAARAQTSTEDGLYLLAAQNQIRLNKYLPAKKVTEIRNLLFQLAPEAQTVEASPRAARASVGKSVTLTIGRALTAVDPLLPTRTLAEAKQMAEEVYPLLYVFENSARTLVARVLRARHGSDWWESRVPERIRNVVKLRKDDEAKNPWHGKRGASQISYTDLEQLGSIVQSNWGDFKAIFPTLNWLTQRLAEIAQSRNPVAHMNPVKKQDANRIRLYVKDWQELMTARREVIPHID